jgi:arylsulfatase A-like enzyme
MGRPNVLCISIDSLRADYTSLFDATAPETTPTLDALASESTIYSRAISPSIWTLPVHTSVFSGLFPPEHGIVSRTAVLGTHPTFPQLLAEQGYETEAFYLNSWFDTGEILRGFGISRDDPGGSSKAQLADRIESVSPTLRTVAERGYKLQKRARAWGLSQPRDAEDSGDRRTTNRAQAAIEDADSPFCFFVHLNDAHYKYDPPTPHHRSFTDRSALGLLYNYEVWQHRVYDDVRNKLRAATGEFRVPEREVETFENL